MIIFASDCLFWSYTQGLLHIKESLYNSISIKKDKPAGNQEKEGYLNPNCIRG